MKLLGTYQNNGAKYNAFKDEDGIYTVPLKIEPEPNPTLIGFWDKQSFEKRFVKTK